MKTLALSLKHYLKLRRSLGYKLREAGALLQRFVLFSKKHHASYVTTKLAVRWANMAVDCHPARKTARLSVVRQFAQYLNAFDPRTEIPPKGIFTDRYRRTHPYLYRDEEVFNLIESANQIPSPKGLRGSTVATLIGLLAVTGMRIGEAVSLDRTDVDLKRGLLTVRRAKGNKSRYVPIHPSTRAVLTRYERLRNGLQPQPQSSRFFLSERGCGLTQGMIRFWFVRISRQIGLRGATDSHGPRVHDLRHRFAIRTLLNWYRSDRDVEVHLPELTTYLGHGRVIDTYWYLTAVPELLRLATQRWQRKGGGPLS
jgi:integrase/recombinase XerD